MSAAPPYPTAGRVQRALVGGICTLTCSGSPDGVFTLDLREELARAVERSLPLVVDVTGLSRSTPTC